MNLTRFYYTIVYIVEMGLLIKMSVLTILTQFPTLEIYSSRLGAHYSTLIRKLNYQGTCVDLYNLTNY